MGGVGRNRGRQPEVAVVVEEAAGPVVRESKPSRTAGGKGRLPGVGPEVAHQNVVEWPHKDRRVRMAAVQQSEVCPGSIARALGSGRDGEDAPQP